jgi:hypothetical protein
VEVEHNGFFCGLGSNLTYVDGTRDLYDNCSAETWSLLWIHHILSELGHELDEKVHVYWCLPRRDITHGLVCIEKDTDTVKMINAAANNKVLCLIVDHTNFLWPLRDDVIVSSTSYQ